VDNTTQPGTVQQAPSLLAVQQVPSFVAMQQAPSSAAGQGQAAGSPRASASL
jgi:hypothetical protein